jgi:hypothetical protein
VDPRTDKQLIEILERFVLRARRIMAHTLCADTVGLRNLADGGWYASRKDGVESLHRRLPGEEITESLAARVRPLLLQDDGVHYATVINALSSLLHRRGRPNDVAWCKQLKKDWKTVDLKIGAAGYSMTLSQVGTDQPAVEITDIGLADSWFYGDLVHADQEQISVGSAFGIEHRFAAAAVRTAQLAILAGELLAYINALVEDGLLTLDEQILSGIPVKVEPKDVELTGLYTAPFGAEMPAVGEEPTAEGWKAALPGNEEGEWILRIPWGGDD